MYGSSNGLGVGSTGNTFRLIPNRLRYQRPRHTHHASTTPKDTVDTTVPVTEVKETPLNPAQEANEDSSSTAETDRLTEPNPNQSLNMPTQSWPNVFQQVCQKQLFECFRQLKQSLIGHSVFDNTVLAYLDFQHMRELVEEAKRQKSTHGVMSLKVAFNNNAYDLPAETVNMGTYLVSVIERMGPTNHVLVPLNPKQVEFLQGLSTTPNKPMFWPRGNEGISWFTSLS